MLKYMSRLWWKNRIAWYFFLGDKEVEVMLQKIQIFIKMLVCDSSA